MVARELRIPMEACSGNLHVSLSFSFFFFFVRLLRCQLVGLGSMYYSNDGGV